MRTPHVVHALPVLAVLGLSVLAVPAIADPGPAATPGQASPPSASPPSGTAPAEATPAPTPTPAGTPATESTPSSALPAYACVSVVVAADGSAQGTACDPSNGAPSSGQISGPVAVWWPMTNLITCSSVHAEATGQQGHSTITATGCERRL